MRTTKDAEVAGQKNSPQLDARTRADLIARMKELAPYYTPEWRFTPDDPDPGTALFLLFAELYEENRKRLNRVPYKNLVAFLNLFDVSLLPARPATSYVAFALNEGTREPVLIRASTAIHAVTPDGEVPYETSRTVMLTPARWHTVYLSSQKRDSIVRLPQRLLEEATVGTSEPIPLFHFAEGHNLQEHALFVAHRDILTVFGSAVVELAISHSAKPEEAAALCELLADSTAVEWTYADSTDGWRAFDRVEAAYGRIRLYKAEDGELAERELNGAVSRWIRCRLRKETSQRHLKNFETIRMDRLSLKADYVDRYGSGGLEPDLMFFNDIQADPVGFYPFGDQFVQYGLFYIASREALTKRDGRIRLTFTLRSIANRFTPEPKRQIDWKWVMKKSQFEETPPPLASILRVVWEYWNGGAWVRLEAGKEAEELFYRPTAEPQSQTIQFLCPSDLRPLPVNGHDNCWIRARVLQIENAYAPLPVYLSPWIEQVRLSYDGEDRLHVPDSCQTLNNTVYENRLPALYGQGVAFTPFVPLEAEHPALYVGFDAQPSRGPISIYASIVSRRTRGDDFPWLEWEYLRRSDSPGSRPQWMPLKMFDETRGLTESGTLQFVGPTDFAEAAVFGTPGYWIRAVNRDNRFEQTEDGGNGADALPRLNGLFLNTVAVEQRQTVPVEYPERMEQDRHVYLLAHRHIVDEEVWVDETARVTEEQLADFQQQGEPQFEAIRDSDGKLQRVWVRWMETARLADSEAKSRHYTLDRTFGQLRFGDGVNGMEPPQEGLENVRVLYRVTLGRHGNTDAGTITSLQNAIAFVGGVTNVVPAAGGCDPETLESALRRGPRLLKHRDRAVSAEDFEWIARDAHPNIAKVKCMANRNAWMEPSPAAITLVVLPKEGRSGLGAFGELRKRVESYVLERASSLVAWPEQLRVIPPAFLEIGITAVVAVEYMDEALPVELAAIEKLTQFLDPLAGNFDGRGWEIGQTIHPSVFYALLKTIRNIAFVEKLYMSVYKLEDNQRVELDGNRPLHVPHGVIASGKHQVTVRVV